jgi:gamma-glutamylcyclotransferase (GGCT)/AIG2-like uncharacterized protein YtfP
MPSQPKHLFVYGTLRRGLPDLNGWQKKFGAKLIGQGSIRAGLYNLGKYPGALPSQSHRTHGEVYRLENPATALKQIDRYEEYDEKEKDKSLYIRRPVTVTLRDGKTVVAWVYFYNGTIPKSKLIPGGRFKRRKIASST